MDRNSPTRVRHVAIAPATESCLAIAGDPPRQPYTCQTCSKRKVKCDKVSPVCTSCRKGKLECFYQPPPPRKRKLSGDLYERLAQYESILLHHGLLPKDSERTSMDSVSVRWTEPSGKLLASPGKSRYIGSNLWHDLGDEMHRIPNDDKEVSEVDDGISNGLVSDPLTAALMGSHESLLQYHPTPENAALMWKMHIENVEPLCKVLHIPSTGNKLDVVSRDPVTASKADECLLFAIYHFAVFSMAEEDSETKLGESRATLMQRYHFATRQALVNASFLKTTEMSILQALVLFLLSCRYSYDPHTYWILTGVAVRIAQRMGLHRDGEKLGLPPFEVQMKRRLFYQLLPLDGVASQLSGTSMGIIPETWDTQPAQNINDDQIWPGMTETPQEQSSATEMVFCLARSCIGNYSAKSGRSANNAKSGQFKDQREAELTIIEAENVVEEKYVRYCDIVNPLHVLTIGSIRSGITAMRLRMRLSKSSSHSPTVAEQRDLFQLSLKIMETDTALHAQVGLKKFHWYMKPFFLWGSWDSFITILSTLRCSDILSPAEIDEAWSKVEQAYDCHGEFLESNRELPLAFGRVTLKAWNVNPPRTVPEPAFITSLRTLHKLNLEIDTERLHVNATGTTDNGPVDVSSADDISVDGFDANGTDWTYWDQLILDYQAQGG